MIAGTARKMLAFGILLAALECAAAGAPASADSLIDKMMSNLMQVRDFRCEALLNASFSGSGISNMRMTVFYKRPDKVKVEANEGFAALPSDGLYIGNPVSELLRRYRLKPLGPATYAGIKCAKYAATPISPQDASVSQLRLYIDQAKALPAGLSGASSGGAFSTVFRYGRTNGFWLPSETTLKLTGGQDRMNGTASITFSDYKTNIGLKDSLFAPPKPGKTGKPR